MTPSNADIRQFIIDTFNDEDFEVFCSDYFPAAMADFSMQMSTKIKAQRLIQYVQNRGFTDDLMAALQKERQEAYAHRLAHGFQDQKAETRVQEEARMTLMLDPMTVITTVGAGLSLVDRFVDMVRKMRGDQPKPFTVQARKEADALVIKRTSGANLDEVKVSANELHLNEWDQVRYKALETKAKLIWGQFNALDAALPTLSLDEKVRIQQRMDLMRQELCPAFREMVDIYEKTLGLSLADHYSLYEICSN